ncbi:trace amine-associated receptor 9-like [Montipora foliosa]|uniref:trace amine-associated receptor 9-like n=1 Tax=Montipora foliosa TaxID=591990 RepID=UPI0035F192DB
MGLGEPPECQNSTAPQILSFTSATVSSVLMLITTPANLLVCVAFVKDPYKTLKTPFNIFLLNIAAADLIVGLGVLPLSITFHVLEGMGIYHDTLIRTLHLIFFISCSASVLGIAVLSLDRYISVTSPLKYRSRVTIKRVKIVSLLMWLISVACPFTYLYVDFIIYSFVFANTIILLTVIILVVVNHNISHSFKAQRKILKSLSDSEIVHSKLAKRDERATNTFLFFLIAFVVLNLPSIGFSFALNFGSYPCGTHHIFRDLELTFILFPSSVNPFIYSLRLPNIRNAIRAIAYKVMPNFATSKTTSVTVRASHALEEEWIGQRKLQPFLDVGSVAHQSLSIHTRTRISDKTVKRTTSLMSDPRVRTLTLERSTSHFYRETTIV